MPDKLLSIYRLQAIRIFPTLWQKPQKDISHIHGMIHASPATSLVVLFPPIQDLLTPPFIDITWLQSRANIHHTTYLLW